MARPIADYLGFTQEQFVADIKWRVPGRAVAFGISAKLLHVTTLSTGAVFGAASALAHLPCISIYRATENAIKDQEMHIILKKLIPSIVYIFADVLSASLITNTLQFPITFKASFFLATSVPTAILVSAFACLLLLGYTFLEFWNSEIMNSIKEKYPSLKDLSAITELLKFIPNRSE